MRILFACHRFPFPPNRGGKIRPFQMIRHLSQSHEVTVATVAHSEEEVEAGAGLKQHCAEILHEVVPDRQRWTNAVAALLQGRSTSEAYFRSQKLTAKVTAAAQKHSFDLVMVHCAFAAQFTDGVPKTRFIMDFGDLDSGKWFDYAQHRGFPHSFIYGTEAPRLRRLECELASSATYCTVTSTREAEEFATLKLEVPCTVIPNGVDSDYFRPTQIGGADSGVLVFLGRMDYFPNIAGIIRFVEEVFPQIRKSRPDAQLRIVGANPSREVRNLAKTPGVAVTGFVQDVRPYVQDAAVAIAPLWLARGTQNKILESISMGIPVVTTVEGANGVRAERDRDLLVSSDPKEYANLVLSLLNSSALRKKIASSALEQVKVAHRWDSSMKVLDGVLEEVMERSSGRLSGRVL